MDKMTRLIMLYPWDLILVRLVKELLLCSEIFLRYF